MTAPDSAPVTPTLPAEPAGAGDLLLMVHGMAANAAVWQPLLGVAQAQWPGRCLAPDLSGHGSAEHVRAYGFGLWTAELARLLREAGAGSTARVWVIGHSLGGVLGALLASGWFGVPVAGVLALAIKTVWTDAEFARMGELAQAPAKVFPGRDEAVQRYLKVSGLQGLVAPEHPMAQAGVCASVDGRGFRLAADPGVFGASAPGMAALLGCARAPVVYALGAEDRIADAQDLLRYDPQLTVLPGLGHNLHVQDPQVVWRVFQARCLGVASGSVRPA